jgi:HlyD family secretion protein
MFEIVTKDQYKVPSPVAADSERTASEPSLWAELRKVSACGVAIIVLFFGAGGVWATNARLAGAVIAPGIVSAESRRQTIQHLEGGIIRTMRVSEGDRVNVGDELVVLDDIAAQSDDGALHKRLIALAAQEARLEAEQARARTIEFRHPVLEDRSNPVVRDATQREISRLNGRNLTDENRRSVLEQRMAQLRAQVNGYQRQLVGVRRQIALLEQEEGVANEMANKGLERVSRLLGIQRALADRVAAEGELTANIAKAAETITEMQFQIQGIGAQRAESIDAELAETQARRVEADEQIRKSSDRLARTLIRAPAAGIVLNVRLKTPGAVVKPGEPILDLVPTEENLVIDTRVSPRDIDEVHAGASAHVVFPSYPQRNLLRISGRVQKVSADSLQDDPAGDRYYTAKVEIDRNHLKTVAPGLELTPGLPAEVYITTIDRTLAEYLIQPLQLVVERSFREH